MHRLRHAPRTRRTPRTSRARDGAQPCRAQRPRQPTAARRGAREQLAALRTGDGRPHELTIGHNDTRWVENDDPCDGADADTDDLNAIDWSRYASPCSATLARKLQQNVTAIIRELRHLRAGRPTLIRVTNVHNDNIGDPTVPASRRPSNQGRRRPLQRGHLQRRRERKAPHAQTSTTPSTAPPARATTAATSPMITSIPTSAATHLQPSCSHASDTHRSLAEHSYVRFAADTRPR